MTDGLIRQALQQLNVFDLLTSESVIDDMVAYFNRQSDHDQIRSGVISQYGIGIEHVTDPETSTDVRQTYTRQNIKKQVNSGIVETITIGFGNKIVNATATLFTEDSQKYSLEHETIEDLDDAEDVLWKHRDAGGYESAVTKCDERSVEIGSAAVFITYQDSLKYNVIAPSDLRVFFSEYIEENGNRRRTDTTDIEDATVCIIRLSQVDRVNWNYLAIFGRSKMYPNGRYVQYTSSQESTKVPELGDDDVVEYEIEGVGPCNPLSYYANQNPDESLPEYPIATINGGVTDSGDLMPYSTSLWADCVTIDVAASHLLATSQDAARGTLVIKRLHEGAGKSLPNTLHGAIELDVGLDIEHIDHNAESSKIALNVLKNLMIDKAGSYSVPDYMIAPDDDSRLDAGSSGVALEVKTKPLIRKRQQRIKRNKNEVNKIFQVEKSLIHLFDESDGVDLLAECSQIWDAGIIKLPENKKEAADRIISLMDKGILDTIAAIREYYSVATDAEAIDIYETMKARATKYKPLVAEPKKPVGMLRGQAQGNNNGQ